MRCIRERWDTSFNVGVRGTLPLRNRAGRGAYQRADLGPDITAGLTTAVMLIPQGLGYAMLAGLPPIVGLYAATLPLLAYALFGKK